MIEKSVFEFNKFNTVKAYLDHSPDIIDENVFAFIDQYLRDAGYMVAAGLTKH